MRRYWLALGLLLAGLICSLVVPANAETIPGGHYGEVHVSRPHGALRGFVILFSPAGGWTDADQQAADILADNQLLVVGVDTARYVTTLATTQETCHHLVGDAEAISHQLQRELGASMYFTPVMAGIREGARLAEQVLSAAPSNTIAGAVSIDPTPELDARFNPCPPDPTIMHDPGLPGFWGVGTTTQIAQPVQSMIVRLQRAGGRVDTREFAPETSAGEMLLALSKPYLAPRAPHEEDVSDLPLIELPAENPTTRLAIVISGDGGWRDLDKTIAHDLQNWGVSVVGIDSLRYFWSKKTPAQTAVDLARVIRSYTTRWHATSVALIGYSFGADVMPFAYNRLPLPERDKVTMMSLLGFAAAADFEIHVTGWLGVPPTSAALPVMPEITKVPPLLVQCFYGEDEGDSICPRLANLDMAIIRTPGDHHFGRDYEHLAHIILSGWQRRLTGS